MATLSRQHPVELLTPTQRPPSPSYLAFVEYDNLWWPAAVYQQYSQAMQERHDELPPRIRMMLFRKIVRTQNQGKIAQILGHDHLWIEFEEQKDIYLHLPKVQLAYTVQKLGREKYATYQRALDEAMEIMEREEYVSPPSKQTLSESFSKEQQGANTITPRNSGSKLVGSKNKRKDGDRIWGTEQPKKKAKKPSPRAVSSPDTAPPRKRIYKKKNSSTKRKAPTHKAKSRQKSSRFDRRGKLSPNSDGSRDNFYVWRRLWAILKHQGWKIIRAKNPLMDWWYVRPGVNLKNVIANKDYFESKDDVIAWAKEVQLREQVVGLTDESSVDTRVSRHSTDHEEDEDESQPPCSSDDDTSTIASSVQENPKRTLTFAKAWPLLHGEGWKIDFGEEGTVYVRPGKSPGHQVKGEDYFSTADEVIEWLYATGAANQMLNEDDALSLGVQADQYSETEESNSPVEDDGVSRRVTMSPAASKTGKARKNKSKDSVAKKRVVKKTTTNGVLKTERKPQKKRESKTAVLKKEWFHEDEVPPFVSGQNNIWNILKDKFHFRYVSGEYALPTEFANLADCPHSFPLDSDLRKFLCQNGIPNYDESKLSLEESTNLQRWLAFANVPVTNHNSIYKLREVNVLTEEGAKELLKKIGFDEVDSSFYHNNTDTTFESLEDVRTYIRSLSDLFATKEGNNQRRNRHKQEKPALDDDQVLHLRVWAAMSDLSYRKFDVCAE